MNKVKIIKSISQASKARDMMIGEVAIIKNDINCSGKYLMRIFSDKTSYRNGFVLLEDPSTTWELPDFEVEILPKGTKIEIEIG
jgi:hypothetical protein